MSLFRKPKRNVQQRQIDLNDDDDDVKTTTHDDEDPSLEELQSSIAKFKEKKSGKSKNKKQSKVDETEAEKEKKIPSQLLSFDEDLLTGGQYRIYSSFAILSGSPIWLFTQLLNFPFVSLP